MALLSLLHAVQQGQHFPMRQPCRSQARQLSHLREPEELALQPQPAVGSAFCPSGPGWALHTWKPFPGPCRVWSGAGAAHTLPRPAAPGQPRPLPGRWTGRPPSLPVCFQGVCLSLVLCRAAGRSVRSAAAPGGDTEKGWRILPAPPPQSPFHPLFLHKAREVFLLPSLFPPVLPLILPPSPAARVWPGSLGQTCPTCTRTPRRGRLRTPGPPVTPTARERATSS